VKCTGFRYAVGQHSYSRNLNHVILWQEIKRAVNEGVKYNGEVVNVDTSNFSHGAVRVKKDFDVALEAAGLKAAEI